MKKAIITFAIPEFNTIGIKEIKFKDFKNSEETFNNIYKSLNKTLNKNWQSVEFEFNEQTILVCRHWLIETNFNWDESHQIN